MSQQAIPLLSSNGAACCQGDRLNLMVQKYDATNANNASRLDSFVKQESSLLGFSYILALVSRLSFMFEVQVQLDFRLRFRLLKYALM